MLTNVCELLFSFYIILRGKVSIYLNHKKHDENDNIDNEPITNDEISGVFNERSINSFNDDSLNSSLWSSTSSKSKRLREKLGNYVTSLGK